MRSIFIFMPYNPGDVIMALHLVPYLKVRFPDSVLDFIVGDESLGLVKGLSGIDRILILPRRPMRSGFLEGTPINDLLPLLHAQVKPREDGPYSLGINLFQPIFGAFLASYLGAEKKVGLFAEPGAGVKVHTHWMERWMALPAERGALPLHTVDFFRLAVDEALEERDREGHRQALDERNPWPPPNPNALFPAVECEPPIPGADRKFPKAILHPGSAWIGKRWPIENWVALSKALLEAGWEVAITGSQEEAGLKEAWTTDMQAGYPAQLAFYLGALDWEGMKALSARSDWLISGDTVAMHLGAASGCRILALFGASNPRETGPYGSRHLIWETESSGYPPQLALGKPHAGLKELNAGEVIDFLLKGKGPVTGKLLETRLHPELGVQVLRNKAGECEDEGILSRWLSSYGEEPAGMDPGTRPSALEGLLQSLDRACGQPTLENLKELELVEAAWAKESSGSFTWETYRIASNGISISPLTEHLEQRRLRLKRALREWK